ECSRRARVLPVSTLRPRERSLISAARRPQHAPQGNESRLTLQRPENLQQVLRIPRGALAASLDGALVGDLADQIKGEVADHGHVVGALAMARTRSHQPIESPTTEMKLAPGGRRGLRYE